MVVPLFIAVDLTDHLLLSRSTSWASLEVGAILLGANGVYAWLLRRDREPRTLLAWARLESALVVAIPVALALLHGDPQNPLRYGVLVGVVGAAAVLPRTFELALVAGWAVTSMVVADAISVGSRPGGLVHAQVARWAVEAGVVGTVAVLAGYLQHRCRRAETGSSRAQAALAGARAEFEATFDGLHEMVVVTDLEGRVARVNTAFARLVGAKPHQLAGRQLSEILAGHPEGWWAELTPGVCEVNDPILDTVFEVTLERRGDRLVRLVRDVGETRLLAARLVQADKLAAVGVLATGVAYEMSNPSAAVTSNLSEMGRYLVACEGAISELAELAVEAGAADRADQVLRGREVALARREAARALGECLEGMERIGRTLASLRSVARREPAGEPPQPVLLGEVVEAVARTAARELRKTAAAVTLREPCWVMGHRSELVDVVLNLVVNAVQAGERGRPNRVAIEAGRENASAVVRVADTGRGIEPGLMKRLFEPFFTTKAPGEGTGLGLSLARRIVLAHGGSIDVASELGVGSTFTVRLPVIEPPAERVEPA